MKSKARLATDCKLVAKLVASTGGGKTRKENAPMRTKTRKERMAEFVEYHNHGDGECNNVVLKCYAQQEH